MKPGVQTIGGLFGDRLLRRLVVPEFQRDYVWQKNQVEGLLQSILDQYAAYNKCRKTPDFQIVPNKTEGDSATDLPHGIEDDFHAFYARRAFSYNVGFIYAYTHPGIAGEYFLIDGQQRLTTLFLTMAVLAHRHKDTLRSRFMRRYVRGGEAEPTNSKSGHKVLFPKLDYRLREYTSAFFQRFLGWLIDTDTVLTEEGIKDQTWYLRHAFGESDPTIRNLIGNSIVIDRFLDREKAHSGLFDYIEDLVEVWYFDTNESEQGEELYLFLNARGEHLEAHENRKAALLKDVPPDEKETWGRKWEQWQDIFWRNRGTGLEKGKSNPDADIGFNAFLAAVEKLASILKEDGTGEGRLRLIEKAIKWLEFLGLDQPPEITSAMGPDWPWLEKWKREFWKVLNRENPVDFEADKTATVLICGTLLCAKAKKDDSDASRRASLRAIRFFYLRYHNKSTAIEKLGQRAQHLVEIHAHPSADTIVSDDMEFFDTEERSKLRLWRNQPPEQRAEFERLVWEIEDHPFNLDGAGVGETHISHLVDLDDQIRLHDLEKVRDGFRELFPRGDMMLKYEKKIISALIAYGRYYNDFRASYFRRFKFNDWTRTIRGMGTYEAKATTLKSHSFRLFFEDWLRLRDFDSLKRIDHSNIDPENSSDVHEAIRWYAAQLGENMWTKGFLIAVYDCNPTDKDEKFKEMPKMYNLISDLRSKSITLSQSVSHRP